MREIYGFLRLASGLANFGHLSQVHTQVLVQCKLASTCESVWPGLNFAFRVATQLLGLASSCDDSAFDFGPAQTRTQVDASFSAFGQPTQVDTS